MFSSTLNIKVIYLRTRLLVLQSLVVGYLEWPKLALLSFILGTKVNLFSHFIKTKFMRREPVGELTLLSRQMPLQCGGCASTLYKEKQSL